MTADIASYAGMFSSALLAATVLPGASEVLLISLLVSQTGDPWIIIVVATVGNTLGSVVNWACGRFLVRYQNRRWFPVSPAQIERFSSIFQRYGMWSLLFAWAPVGGDALTVIAGTLKVKLLPFTILVGIGKFSRYLIVAGSVLAWPFD